VRAVPLNLPSLHRRQFAQQQFHCGNAPPAALPRILTRMEMVDKGEDPHAGNSSLTCRRAVKGLEIGVAIAVNFGAQTHFFNFRRFPLHNDLFLDRRLLL
jgi:hypothetical protein